MVKWMYKWLKIDQNGQNAHMKLILQYLSSRGRYLTDRYSDPPRLTGALNLF